MSTKITLKTSQVNSQGNLNFLPFSHLTLTMTLNILMSVTSTRIFQPSKHPRDTGNHVNGYSMTNQIQFPLTTLI